MRCLVLAVAVFLPAGAADHNPLLPRPQKIHYGAGRLELVGLSIRFTSAPNAEDRFAAGELVSALSARAGTKIPLAEGAAKKSIVLNRTGSAAALPGLDERTGPDSRESYTIKVTPEGAEIRARSSAGLFYGVQTMRQLVEGNGARASLPEVEIQDWPSVAYRGFMMDTSHGPLPTEAEIKRQIDFLSRFKTNQYYFYSELSIELKGYPLINPGDARYTQEAVRRIIAYARARHVDVVPCLELYGHLHDLFRIERYADLAPVPHGGEFNPRNPGVAPLLRDWIKQMAELFPSPLFHIGLDETWELVRVASQMAGGVEPGKLYIEHFLNVSNLVRQNGKRVMLWADILTRYPHLIPDLPKGTIAVPWVYSPQKDFTRWVGPFAKAHVPMVVASGITCYNEVVPDFYRSFSNIEGLLASGRENGALGLMNTGWADDAQVIYRMSLPAMAFGSVAPWQSVPVDREHFFSDYARALYPPAIAAEVAPALEALAKSQQSFTRALGGQTMHRFWDDPLKPARLKRLQAHQEELHLGRLQAEEAAEHLYLALALKGDPATLSSLLLGARMLDYLGMKHIYAVEIASFFDRLGPNPRRDLANLLLRTEVAAQNHGFLADLMDAITELREPYRNAWLAEYTPYRLETALKRWDAEYQYWRALQGRFENFRFAEGGALPPLDSFRPKQ